MRPESHKMLGSEIRALSPESCALRLEPLITRLKDHASPVMLRGEGIRDLAPYLKAYD